MKIWKFLSLVLIAGCSTVDNVKSGPAAGSPEWFETASPKEIASYLRGQCVASGVMVGTSEMAECIQMEAGFYKQSDTARTAAIAAATARN